MASVRFRPKSPQEQSNGDGDSETEGRRRVATEGRSYSQDFVVTGGVNNDDSDDSFPINQEEKHNTEDEFALIEKLYSTVQPATHNFADVNPSAIAAIGHAPSTSADWSGDRRASIAVFMKDKKLQDRYSLGEDVYAFLFVAPIWSVPFWFSLAVVCLKFLVYGVLSSDIDLLDFNIDRISANVAKFFLIPVAVAMQEDLMHSYFFFANVGWDDSALRYSTSATPNKLLFSYILRTMDGLFSLGVNFAVMLATPEVLNVFLNFAALGFLQSIDDVFYELVLRGFFGDSMEFLGLMCKEITFPRRMGKDNFTFCKGWLRLSHLDSILFGGTILVCLGCYMANCFAIYDVFDQNFFEDLINATNASEAPSVTPFWDGRNNDTDDDGFGTMNATEAVPFG
jgi:hypothetical protein